MPLNYIVDPVIALSSLMNMYKEAKPLYDKVKAPTESPILKQENVELAEPISLVGKNISFTYGDRPILEDFFYVFSYGKNTSSRENLVVENQPLLGSWQENLPLTREKF